MPCEGVPVIHLVGAIKNDNILGQRLAHILDRFRFTSARGSARSTAHAQCQRLGESYIAAERRGQEQKTKDSVIAFKMQKSKN